MLMFMLISKLMILGPILAALGCPFDSINTISFSNMMKRE
jgi:hypothetical protein